MLRGIILEVVLFLTNRLALLNRSIEISRSLSTLQLMAPSSPRHLLLRSAEKWSFLWVVL